MRIEVLDSTLRDGAQAEGVGLSLDDKWAIAHVLDDLGVDFIEAGAPSFNPKDAAFFARAAGETLRHTHLAAFGATCRPGMRAQDDPGLTALVTCGAGVVTLFGKASLTHVETVLRVSPEENLRMIRESVAFLTRGGLTVFFDAEHFFDGYRDDADYALQTLRAAERGGARLAVLCDTNGGALPWDVESAMQSAARETAMPLGIHAHNDAGLAVANTLAGVRGGAVHVQGTVGGVGERCGNADLCAVTADIAFKLHMDCLREGAIRGLTHAAHKVYEIMNLSMSRRMPYVGRSAFAHKAGMHIDGVLKQPDTFEHVPPESVGNERRLLLSEQAGRAAMLARVRQLLPGETLDTASAQRLVDEIKRREMRGYSYENAEGSLALIAMDALGRRRRFYEVRDFHVLSGHADHTASAQAYIKISVDGREEITAAEGDGPVNALDCALRKALCVFYPQLSAFHLTDFKVRVIDMGGTASTVRVLIESACDGHSFSTVGVSSNMLKACFDALTDSVDYGLTFLAP